MTAKLAGRIGFRGSGILPLFAFASDYRPFEKSKIGSDAAKEQRVIAYRGIRPDALFSCEREQRRDAAATDSENSSPLWRRIYFKCDEAGFSNQIRV